MQGALGPRRNAVLPGGHSRRDAGAREQGCVLPRLHSPPESLSGQGSYPTTNQTGFFKASALAARFFNWLGRIVSVTLPASTKRTRSGSADRGS